MKGRLPKEGSDFYLPEHTYRMVQHFCLSYQEMQKERSDMTVLRSPLLTDMPHGTNVSDSTAREAMRLEDLTRKIDIIDTAISDTAKETSPEGMKWLRMAVTQGKSFRELILLGCPFDHNVFGKMKRLVYWKVAQEI